MDVEQVLDKHDIEPNRSKNIECPSPTHDDNDPSCRVNEDYVYCFSCGFSADAAGLEAALSDRDVGEVLREWQSPRMPWEKATKVTTKVPKHKQRVRLYSTWVALSQDKIQEVIDILPEHLHQAALEQTWELLDEVMGIWKDASPHELTTEIAYYELELDRWADYWRRMT
jgi:hypothetical protein